MLESHVNAEEAEVSFSPTSNIIPKTLRCFITNSYRTLPNLPLLGCIRHMPSCVQELAKPTTPQ